MTITRRAGKNVDRAYQRVEAPCGCVNVIDGSIEHCAFHSSTVDLLNALRPFVDILKELAPGTDGTHIPASVSMRDLIAARDAMRRAGGQS